ncbi:hypothetical protein PtB15_16B108 [Puccinia triticina]|nr:hypothetical protein PtB15_16B108 [Puccinia triticina]
MTAEEALELQEFYSHLNSIPHDHSVVVILNQVQPQWMDLFLNKLMDAIDSLLERWVKNSPSLPLSYSLSLPDKSPCPTHLISHDLPDGSGIFLAEQHDDNNWQDISPFPNLFSASASICADPSRLTGPTGAPVFPQPDVSQRLPTATITTPGNLCLAQMGSETTTRPESQQIALLRLQYRCPSAPS